MYRTAPYVEINCVCGSIYYRITFIGKPACPNCGVFTGLFDSPDGTVKEFPDNLDIKQFLDINEWYPDL